MENEDPSHFTSGFVAIIGEPNVGKSTLLNALLGQKLSIVTPKPQTTRHKILGIRNDSGSQIVFLDTPGIIEPRYLLQEVMMRFASSAVEDADLVLLLIDAEKANRKEYKEDSTAFNTIRNSPKKTFLLLNKIDLLKKTELLPVIEASKDIFPFDEIIPLSASKGFGVDVLLKTIVQYLPEHPPFYSTDYISEAPEKFFVAELIREKIFTQFSEEIPYSTTVDIVEFKERKAEKHFISADIIVERQSQKGILIGKGGAALRSLGSTARREIESFLGHPVFLELHVKVRAQWRENAEWLKRFGYQE